MITKDKLKVYKRYKGEIDRWVRSGSKKEKSIMTDNDWYLIDGFNQDLFLLERGLISSDFKNELTTRLKESCENEFIVNQLKELTSQY